MLTSNDAVFLYLAEKGASRHSEQSCRDAFVSLGFVQSIDQPLSFVGHKLGIPIFAGRQFRSGAGPGGIRKVVRQKWECGCESRLVRWTWERVGSSRLKRPSRGAAGEVVDGLAAAIPAASRQTSRPARRPERRPAPGHFPARGCCQASRKPPEPQQPRDRCA